MKKTDTTNPQLIETINMLRKQGREQDAPVWHDLANRLAKSRRIRSTVNLSRLDRFTQRNDTVAVPGKVLSSGEINHALTVTAFGFSEKAKEKIKKSKGKCLTFADLMKKNPKGSNIKIIG